MTNAGTPFTGTLRTTVRDLGGVEVALVDERAATLDFGEGSSYSVVWDTGATFAAGYRFRLAAVANDGSLSVETEVPFRVLPELDVTARLLALTPEVTEGDSAGFDATIDNLSVSAALGGAVSRFSIEPEGGGAASFEERSAAADRAAGAGCGERRSRGRRPRRRARTPRV